MMREVKPEYKLARQLLVELIHSVLVALDCLRGENYIASILFLLYLLIDKPN